MVYSNLGDAKSTRVWWAAAALALIVVGMTVRPGDAPWWFDMSRNFDLALKFNATPVHVLGISLPGMPATYGLKGTHGIRYGPLPIWIDQVFLLFTRNPITMTAVRTAVVAALTALALLWLSRIMGVSPWLAVVVMLSPWILYYCKQMWDNSLAIVPTALLLAAYGDFLIRRKPASLCLVIVCMAIMCLVHLMAVAFIFPVAIHLLVFERKWVLNFKWPLVVVTAVMLLISVPYLHYLATFHGSSLPEHVSRWRGWVFPLFGAQHITGANTGYILEETWHHIYPSILRYPYVLVRLFTYTGIVACWMGMAMAIPRAMRAIRQREKAGVMDHLCLIGWGTFICQTLFDGIEHVSKHPHYYNCTWIVYIMFAWIAFDAIPRWLGPGSVIGRLVIPVYAASLLFITTVVAIQIVHNGGTRGDHYDAVLSNQWQVAKDVKKFSDARPINIRIPNWEKRPDAPAVLFKLAEPGTGDRPTKSLVIRFAGRAPDARIIVEEQSLNSATSEGATGSVR